MTRRILIITGLMLFWAVNVQAVGDWDIYSDAEIHDGDEYSNVSVFDTPPEHTTLDMFGGLVDGIEAFDESTINISGGYVSTLNSFEFSTVNAFGGAIGGLYAYDTGTVNVWGDGNVLSLLSRGDSSVVSMWGGEVWHIAALEFGTVNLSGGLVTDSLGVIDSGIINIYGYGLIKEPTGGKYGYGFVSGYWTDSTPFSIDLNGADTYSRVMLIPEPSTLLLIFAGGLLLRSKAKLAQSRKGEAI